MEKDKTQLGIFHKFNITRVDGTDAPGGKHEGCDYFVLDCTHDKFAAAAIYAYAKACESEYPVLAGDLMAKYERMTGQLDVPGIPGAEIQ